jgi:segregation and condensation protein B
MNKRAMVEAAVFVSEKPLSVEEISKIAGIPAEEVKKIVAQMLSDLAKEDHGYELVETPEGFELRVKTDYRDKVAKLAPLADLSEGMMRTLAIVAAKQPVRQSLIVRYQGNKTYGYIVRLEDKGLVKTEKAGRTKIITTTPDFERYFGKNKDEIKSYLSGVREKTEDVEPKVEKKEEEGMGKEKEGGEEGWE